MFLVKKVKELKNTAVKSFIPKTLPKIGFLFIHGVANTKFTGRFPLNPRAVTRMLQLFYTLKSSVRCTGILLQHGKRHGSAKQSF
jgi:hypothetical protein